MSRPRDRDMSYEEEDTYMSYEEENTCDALKTETCEGLMTPFCLVFLGDNV